MVDLFVDRVLVKNNKDQDELDTEREIVTRLQNRILMLFFASAESETCQRFAPTLHDFFKQLTDEFYVERSAQLVLLYIRELETKFDVREVPTVVVLRPDCSVLIPNAVEEITRMGPDCYRNWHEAAELIDRNFLTKEDFEDKSMRSFSDPVRRLKYKVEEEEKKKEEKKKKKKKKQRRGWGGGGDKGEEAGAGGADDKDGGGSMW
ncbi:nucleoredoxin-like protein 1 isoform X2 [Poecilia reticulata]|uniref:nucleoredoxin-like protein 1 isoform X2 n=1 Tax=Poecilia reticulata TaxID=8081 RepID=UPI0007EA30A7|nr:PREDICTED: nucleoredoxin-like protein 1 isoform X2 [Poecilia reticulata]